MNLESAKVTSEEKVELCKKYFYLGWLALPFVWGINAVWFYKEAFIKPEFPGQVRVSVYLKHTDSSKSHFLFQSTIKKLVIASGFGALVWLVGIIAWMSVFTMNRAEWGAVADRMSFNIPVGTP